MSIELMNLAFESPLPPGRKFVLVCLCDRTRHDSDFCYPSVKWICRRTSMSERAVQKHLSDLEADGIVVRAKKQGHRNTYHIAADRIREWIPNPAQTPPAKSANPRRICTPADSAPPQNLQDTPADSAPNTLENHQEASSKRSGAAGSPRKLGKVTLKVYLDACTKAGVEAITEDDPVIRYAEQVGLPDMFLRLAWKVFATKYIDTANKQASWPQHFRNAVKANWFRVWYLGNDNKFALTTTGRQAALEFNEVMEPA